jgi:hypothetical protein
VFKAKKELLALNQMMSRNYGGIKRSIRRSVTCAWNYGKAVGVTEKELADEIRAIISR